MKELFSGTDMMDESEKTIEDFKLLDLFVPAVKFGDAVSIGRWLRYRFSGEYVGHVRFSVNSFICAG
jgi:hypothetical protein